MSLPRDGGVIGLTVAQPAPEFSLQPPETKREASQSVGAAGARDMAADPHGAIFFPVGYVLGRVVGGIFGVSESELESATRSISAVVQAHPVDVRLRQMILDQLNAAYPGKVRLLAANVPLEPETTHGKMRHDEGRRLGWSKTRPASHPLAGTGVDFVVGLRVTNLGFQIRSHPHVRSTGDVEKLNPPLSLALTADIVAVRVRDWAGLGGLTIAYEGKPRKFTDWADRDAEPLHRELEDALQEIRQQIVRELSRGSAPDAPAGTAT